MSNATTWRIDPDTYALVADSPHPGGYTLAEINAIERPPCPLCGATILVDTVDITTSEDMPHRKYVPGLMACPNGCDPARALRERKRG